MFRLVANDAMKQLYKPVQGTQTAGVRRRLILTKDGNILRNRGGKGTCKRGDDKKKRMRGKVQDLF